MTTMREGLCDCDDNSHGARVVFKVLGTAVLDDGKTLFHGKCPKCEQHRVLVHPIVGLEKDKQLLGRTAYDVTDPQTLDQLCDNLGIPELNVKEIFDDWPS